MSFESFPIGTDNNPLRHNLWCQQDEGTEISPGDSKFITAENGTILTTESGILLTTEG